MTKRLLRRRRPPASRLSRGFTFYLAPFALKTLERASESVCGVFPDHRIGYVNAAWVAFGRGNDGGPGEDVLGKNILSVVPPVLREYHERLLAWARSTNEPVEHEYECSTPEVRRVFRMRIHACHSGGFVIVHSFLRELMATSERLPALDAFYRDARGLVVQCSNCRRVRRTPGASATADVWDWVPDYVAQLSPHTSHSICAVCADFYYSNLSL